MQSSTPKGEKLAKLNRFDKILLVSYFFIFFLTLILTPFCLGNVTMILQLVAIYFLSARQLFYYFGLDTLAASRIFLHFHTFTNRRIFHFTDDESNGQLS